MEVLSAKLGILAGLFGVVGLIGLAALLGSVIWLIIRVANFDSMLPALLGVVLSLALAVGGMVLTPPPEVVHMEPLKAPWTMVLERIAQIKEGRKGGDPEDDAGPGDDAVPGDDSVGDDRASDAAPGSPAGNTDSTSQTGAPFADTAAAKREEALGDMPDATLDGGGEEDIWGISGSTIEMLTTTLAGDKRLLETEINGCRLKLTLPEDWDETRFAIFKEKGRLNFYRRGTVGAGEEKWLFILEVLDSPVDPGYLGQPYSLIENREIRMETGGKALAFRSPLKTPEYPSESYRRMQDAIPGILETVEFEPV